MTAGDEPSRSSVDRAGIVLRRHQAGALVRPDEHDHAVSVLLDWRRGFAEPLTKTVMGVRSFLATLTDDPPHGRVGQRLKRRARIVEKLARLPSMRLSQMEDIAGCRVLVDDMADLRALEKRIAASWSVRRTDDDVGVPKASGYRAVHVVVERDARLVEVQLRIPEHHAWAQLVDEIALLGGVLRGVKDGVGPTDILEPLHELGEVLDRASRGERDDARMAMLLSHLDAAIARHSRVSP